MVHAEVEAGRAQPLGHDAFGLAAVDRQNAVAEVEPDTMRSEHLVSAVRKLVVAIAVGRSAHEAVMGAVHAHVGDLAAALVHGAVSRIVIPDVEQIGDHRVIASHIHDVRAPESDLEPARGLQNVLVDEA